MRICGTKLKNKVKKYINVIVLSGILLTSCNQSKLEKIEISWLPAADVDLQIENYKKADRIENAYFNDENILVFELTDEQRQAWLEFINDDIEKYLQEVNDIEFLEMDMSADAKELVAYADKRVNFESFGTYFMILAYDAELKQVLEGTKSWELSFTLKDINSKEEIYSAKLPQETVRISIELWNKDEE